MEQEIKPPPWLVFPDLPRGSMGWRMGPGEGYYDSFCVWFSRLDEGTREEYISNYPEPPEWHGFYQMITDHPWPDTEP
jgi:hypothetical protein